MFNALAICYLRHLNAEALCEAEHHHVNAVGVADEMVIEHEIVLVARELPDADLTHPAEADLLHLDAPGVTSVGRGGGEAPRPSLVPGLQSLGNLAWSRIEMYIENKTRAS